MSACNCSQEDIGLAQEDCIRHSKCPQLWCDLCSCAFPVSFLVTHTKADKHRKKFRCYREALHLLSLPKPPRCHFEFLDKYLAEFARRHSLTPEELEARRQSIDRLDKLIKDKVSDRCSLRLFGSTISGYATKQSNINLDLKVEKLPQKECKDGAASSTSEKAGEQDDSIVGESDAEMLAKIALCIQSEKAIYKDLKKEFNLKVPKIQFTEVVKEEGVENEAATKHHFELILSADKSYQTSEMIRTYSQLDERVHILGMCFRKWAEFCNLDNQENGTWPSHAFIVMVIYFLQRRNPPVLPYLQEAHDRKQPEAPASKDALNANADASPNGPGANDEDDIEAAAKKFSELDIKAIVENWCSSNTESVGELWIAFWKFFATEFRAGHHVLSIRKSEKPMTHKEKGWSTRVIAIEEPCRQNLNLSRSVGNMQIFEIFMYMFRKTFEYYVTPDTQDGPCFTKEDFKLSMGEVDTSDDSNPVNIRRRLRTESHTSTGDFSSEGSGDDSDDSDYDSNDRLVSKRDQASSYRLALSLAAKFGHKLELFAPNLVEHWAKLVDEKKLVMTINFKKKPFFRHPGKYCHLCHKTGHMQSKCPIEELPELIPLPDKMSPEQIRIIDDICLAIHRNSRINPETEMQHTFIADELQQFIRRLGHSLSDVELFGSSRNGFGADKCDLDMCLTFSDNDTGEGLDPVKIIENLAELLKTHEHIDKDSILPITAAKVPIVKFNYDYCGRIYLCDISLYNVLAKANTKLLKTYCLIDERVEILGLVTKLFAKTCQIGDASRGSLSSYAFTLLTLHYLQQRKPPVIPVLQELYQGTKPSDMVRSTIGIPYNAWFYQDLNNLQKLWPGLGQNKESVAELFLGFLRYFSEEFKFDENVVCTRQLKPLTRLEKMWTGKKLAIEDPFLLAHNLGQGVDNQMAIFIKTTFCMGRNHFGFLPNIENFFGLPLEKHFQYYFNQQRLTRGTLPSGRGCRLCGKIGHKIKECESRPKNRQGRRGPGQNSYGNQLRTCNNCGSSQHLFKDCPTNSRNRPWPQQQQQQRQQNRNYGQNQSDGYARGGGGGYHLQQQQHQRNTGMEYASSRGSFEGQGNDQQRRMPPQNLNQRFDTMDGGQGNFGHQQQQQRTNANGFSMNNVQFPALGDRGQGNNAQRSPMKSPGGERVFVNRNRQFQ